MKYFVILLVVYNDGTADKVAIYKQATKDAAIKAFHSYMTQYTDVPNVASVNVEAKDQLGTIIKNEYWKPENE